MTEDRERRYTDTEYETYAPEENSSASTIQGVTIAIAVAAVGCLAIEPAVSLVLWLLLFPVGLAAYAARRDADEKVSAALKDERNRIQTGVTEVAKKLEDVAGRIGEIRAKGNVVMAGDGAIVIIDSVVLESFKNLQREDPILADAIKTISGEVERSQNEAAAKSWALFLKELSGQKDKTTLEALWDNVIKHAPSVSSLIESVAKIVAVFT